VRAGQPTFIGRLMARLPEVATLEAATAGPLSPRGGSWPVELQLRLRWAGPAGQAANGYQTWVKA